MASRGLSEHDRRAGNTTINNKTRLDIRTQILHTKMAGTGLTFVTITDSDSVNLDSKLGNHTRRYAGILMVKQLLKS